MRYVALALLATIVPRITSACSEDPCVASPRWVGVELHSPSPIALDGAFVFRVSDRHEACLGYIAHALAIRVTLLDEPVPGEVVQFAGLPDMFAWRPDSLLTAKATYRVTVSLANDTIPADDSEIFGPCGPPELIAEFVLVTGDTLMTPPQLEPPTLTLVDLTWDTDLRGVACCPDVIPWFDNGSCFPEVGWYPPTACTLLHGSVNESFTAELPNISGPDARQFAYQLLIDDIVVARDLDATNLEARHESAACARLEALHLATGTIYSSPETCPSPESAAMLGPHSIAKTLPCVDPQTCAMDYGDWEGTCRPFEPDAPPKPVAWPTDSELWIRCPDFTLALDSAGADTPSDPDTPTVTTDPVTTDSSTGTTAGESDLPDRGCTCAQTPTPSPLWLLTLLLLPRRPVVAAVTSAPPAHSRPAAPAAPAHRAARAD